MANVHFKGNVVNLEGVVPNIGDKIEKFTLVGKDLNDIVVGGKSDVLQILITVPSLDTGICATETRTFNKNAAGNKNVKLTVISMDLPFAMGRFCSVEGIENVAPASDFRNKDFGKKFGILIKDGPLAGLLARAIFVVDKDGTLIYKQIVDEIASEPNYEDLKNAIGAKCGCSCNCKIN